jgi:hypothetical protein
MSLTFNQTASGGLVVRELSSSALDTWVQAWIGSNQSLLNSLLSTQH